MSKIRNTVKSVLVPTLFNLGVYARSIERHHKNKIVILSGHRVSSATHEERNGVLPLELETGIPSERFEELLHFIKEKMNPVSLEDIVSFVNGKKDIPDRAVAVTLDDGYMDNYTNAFPLLKQYGIPATIFLATGFINNDVMFWWDRIGEILKRTKIKNLEANRIGDFLNGNRGSLPDRLDLSTQDSRNNTWDSLTKILRRYETDRIERVIRVLEEDLEVTPGSYQHDCAMLTWDQVLEMSKNGIDFGAHTVTHPSLPSLTPDDCEKEALESKKAIEERIQKPVISFAYPFGDFDRDKRAIMRKKLSDGGFQCAFLVEQGYACKESDPFELKRVYVGNAPLGMTVRAFTSVVQRNSY